MVKLMDSRAGYLGPMMRAAIQNHLGVPEVAKLLVTLLSNVHLTLV
jgi:hypothetical protein